MFKKIGLLCALLIILLSVDVFAAGSCSNSMVKESGLRIISFNWTSDGSGDVSGVGSVTKITGVIMGVLFIPNSTDQPTNLYDVTILNSGGADVLHGVGVDLPQATTDTGAYRTPFTTDGGVVVLNNETLEIKVQHAGSAKKGKIFLILNG